MAKIFLMICFFVTALFAAGGASVAQSLSDLNVQAFNSLSKGEEKRVPVSPFTGGVSAAEDLTLEDLSLNGTAMNESRAFALISGYLVSRGDKIAGFRVDAIEKGRVVLRRADEVYVLTMGGL